jgi:DNA-binding HxlR family transcriptional regulator
VRGSWDTSPVTTEEIQRVICLSAQPATETAVLAAWYEPISSSEQACRVPAMQGEDEMSRNSLPSQCERVRARPEDFEMIELGREALDLLHAKWKLDLLCLLASGIRRPARLLDNLPGISKKVLTAALRGLQHDGLVTRHVYAEVPARVEYALTPLGWSLTEVLMVLYEWASAHVDEVKAARATAGWEGSDDGDGSLRPLFELDSTAA